MKERIANITKEKCEEWAKNPLYNPLVKTTTKTQLNPNADTYKQLKEACFQKYNIISDNAPVQTQGEPSNTRRTTQQTKPKLPRYITINDDNYHVPQNREEWNTFKEKLLKLINAIQITHNYIPSNDNLFNEILACINICSLLLNLNNNIIIPEDELNNILKKFLSIYDKDKIYRNDGIWRVKADGQSISLVGLCEIYDKFTNSIVFNNQLPNEYNIRNLAKWFIYHIFGYAIKGWYSTQHYTDLITAKEIFDDTHQHYYKINKEKLDHDDFSISESKSRSLPQSISIEKIVNKRLKPKQMIKKTVQILNRDTKKMETFESMVPDPSQPDEFLEQVFYSEPSLNRSNFRSHEQLSRLSPFKHSEANQLPKLTIEKRTKILKDLKQACNEMQDNISGKRFDRMNKKNLLFIIKVGNKNKEGKQRCYYARNIYKLWQEAEKNNVAFVDPETRIPINLDEKEDIMKKIKYLNPKAIRPDERSKLKKDPRLELLFTPKDKFYLLQSQYNLIHNYVFVLEDLGYIPADIELEHVDGAANLTSAAVIGSLQALFDKGKVMESNFIPFSCCKIHLRKTIEYWTTPSKTTVKKADGKDKLDWRGRVIQVDVPLVNGINMERWKLFASEIYTNL